VVEIEVELIHMRQFCHMSGNNSATGCLLHIADSLAEASYIPPLITHLYISG
jgi:hypothetical protein